MNPILVTMNNCNVDPMTLTVLCAISVFLMWFKLFYWMQLFESTASFIRIIECIVLDILPFLKMLAICICMFGCTQATIIQYKLETLTSSVFGIKFIDALVREYLNGLGQGDDVNFSYGDSPF